MDAKEMLLKEKLESLLTQASKAAAELQALKQGDSTPHFDVIELPAHDLGTRLSRAIHEERARELALSKLKGTRCIDCNQLCKIELEVRNVNSMDGSIELTEKAKGGVDHKPGRLPLLAFDKRLRLRIKIA